MAHHILDDATYHSQRKAVIMATVWLTVITIIEVVAALVWMSVFPEGGPRMLLNSFFILASLLKAYFIVGEFMHVRYETRALALTILVPTVFLIWFIIAFLWEGAEWKQNRMDWNAMPVLTPAVEHHHDDHGHDHDDHKHEDHDHDHKGGGH